MSDPTKFRDWLYTPTEQPPLKPKLKALKRPIWTENKAKLIQRYLYYFVLVTKHGAYIDAFAGPQRANKLDAWAAKLVLEGQPKSFHLRHYYLFELDEQKIPLLEELRAQYATSDPKQRLSIEVKPGDCNFPLPQFLESRPIKEREATFCLLDQRTFECHWATLEALSRYKKTGSKIELFYFLPNAWLPRAVSRLKNVERLRLWWGRDDHGDFLKLTQSKRLEAVCERFRSELGYVYVTPFPIHEKRGSRRVMYYMVHATDHPQAPKLMTHAYNTAVLPPEPEEQMRLVLLA